VPCANRLLLLACSLPFHITVLAGLTVLATGGCQRDRQVSVRVSIPNADSIETPAAGVGVIALPYDRDSVLASLEARARTPRPSTAALDSLFAGFRGPFTTYTAISYTASKLRDSLDQLRQNLKAISPGSADHRELSARVRQLADSLHRAEARAERARRTLDQARTEFVSRSETLRAELRQWQDSTYQGWDSIVEGLSSARGRPASTDTTDNTGWARFSLRPGRWWLYAQAWDTSDPNSEWYWNVPVDDDTVLLSSRTGRRRPRY
jgi:Designed helical repeat protein 10 domain